MRCLENESFCLNIGRKTHAPSPPPPPLALHSFLPALSDLPRHVLRLPILRDAVLQRGQFLRSLFRASVVFLFGQKHPNFESDLGSGPPGGNKYLLARKQGLREEIGRIQNPLFNTMVGWRVRKEKKRVWRLKEMLRPINKNVPR